jgi:hypothetical protein
VSNCTFSGFRPTEPGPGVAKALYCFNWVDTGAGQVSVTITGNTLTNNQTAIQLTGDPYSADPGQLRMTARVHGNTITGIGPAPGWNVGMLLECGVTGDVTQNLFSSFERTDGSTTTSAALQGWDRLFRAHGRFVPLQPLNFEGNTFTNNGLHMLLLGAKDSRIVNNTFLGLGPGALTGGGLDLNGTNVLVAKNNFSDMPTGIRLVGPPETWPPPWSTLPLTHNPSLVDNWFCNVPEPIQVDPLITVMQEHGTETNCAFAPRFQSITSANGEILTSLRGWHGDSYVIETSTDLQNWEPVHAVSMTLPLYEFRDTYTAGIPCRFYRAFKQ